MIYSENDKKAHIRELQSYLYGISAHNKNIPPVIPDGFYGDDTAAAVTAFQNEYNLPVTGEVNRETWDAIVLIYDHLLNTPPASIDIFPSTVGYTLQEGDKNYLVYILQIMLDSINETYTNAPPVNINGNYTKDTTDAVKFIQRVSNFYVTGNVDKYTWSNIVNLFQHSYRPIE